MAKIKVQNQKRAHSRQEYLNCDWNSDTKIWMEDVQGGNLSACKRIFYKESILTKSLLAKKRPKLGIQLPNAGDNNQSCRLLTVIFYRIDQLRIL